MGRSLDNTPRGSRVLNPQLTGGGQSNSHCRWLRQLQHHTEDNPEYFVDTHETYNQNGSCIVPRCVGGM